MKKIFILVAIIMYCFMGIGFCADGFYVIPVKGNDANLTPENIKCGIYIFGVRGTNGCYAIGDTGPAGGIVFYITDGGLHGLEAAPVDQSSFPKWGCDGTAIVGADGTVVGTGAQNTIDIMNQCGESGIAVKVAMSYMLNGISGWFLPSKDELNLLYQNKGVVGSFADDLYLSSSEATSYNAWGQVFSTGFQFSPDKDVAYRVRAVRAF